MQNFYSGYTGVMYSVGGIDTTIIIAVFVVIIAVLVVAITVAVITLVICRKAKSSKYDHYN